MADLNPCPTCGGPTTALLFSTFCAKCEFGGEKTSINEGFIIWRNRPPGSTEYVFKTSEYAEAWRAAASLGQFPIRRVRSKKPLKWRESSGSVEGILLAEGVYEIWAAEVERPDSFQWVWLVAG